MQFFKSDAKRLDVSYDTKNVNGASSSESTVALLGARLDEEAFATSVFRKLHSRILPFTALIVMLSYLDRGNLGFVAADVCAELGMNHTRYGIGVALFGVGYITSQIPSNYLLRRFGPILWFAFLLVSWGAVAASFSLVQSLTGFYILRFFLGVAEGGTFPGVWYFLTIFFPPDRLTFPYSTIEASISIASPLAAPIAAGLLSLDGLFGVSGWRLLFLVEGILPILYGGILFWLLPPSIESARFLSAEDKEYLHGKHSAEDSTNTRTLWQEISTVSKNKNFWIVVFNAAIRGMLLTAAFYWTTLLIDEMLNGDDDEDEDDDEDGDDTCASSKTTTIASVSLTAVPFTVAAAFSLWFGHVTTSVRNRSRLAGCIMASSGFFLYGWVIFRHISLVCALISFSFGISFFISLNALIVGLVGSYYDKETKATALALFNTLNGVGMIVGPIFIGFMVDYQGYGVAITCLAVSALIGGLTLLTATDPLTTQRLDLTDCQQAP